MDQSFDINVLREESKTRWLKPSEVYYILQNHERFPITPEPPKKPPSGSLFLYNRRVNRYFRRDGHAWRRKKDGRTVAEAHERLKVGNVDGLSCYYAHGEENPCFQRRCFWMLEPAYEHIVLVQYREVSEGRYYSSQLSNGPPESLSSLRHSNAIYGNQYHSSASGISEGSESHQSYSNLSSVTELSSYSENREYNKDGASLLSIPELGQTCLEQTTEVCRTDNGNSTNKSGLNLALKKLAEQLSLGDDDDDYLYSNQAQPLGSATNIEAAVKAATCIQTAFHTYMSTKRRQKTANYGDEYGTTRANSDEFKTTSRLQYHYNAVSIQLHDKAAALIQKRFRIWMQQKKFLGVKIQALLRAHQAKKQIYGNTAADELASARWSAKGTGYQDFRMPTSSSSSENQLGEYSELTKNFKRRKIGNDVCIISSREDTSDPRHLDSGSSLERVKVQYSTLYSDVKAWLAMGKQWEKRGLHHTCVQQAASQLHGTSDIKKLITEEILLNRNGGNNCTIICIISGSGLGKTTLLHVLYNDQQLLDAFDMRIWIQMSQRFDREMLFRKTIEFITHVQCRIANLNFLEEMTKETLTDKKFLLFLDDADIEDEHFWTNVLEVLNAGAKGSVIVIATSSSTVAALTGVATHSYRLGPLSEENNLMLLQQYAGDGYIKSSPELVTLAKKFVARFGANPLNLKAFGGLLYHADTVLLDLDKLGRKTVPCLQLCHDVLPKHLKNCLAFCSLFPKGYIFDKHHTVLLWLSRGFIVPVEGRELEDVGVEYFNELLYRSFFQYSPSHDYKEDKFVVHELIYNVVLSVSYDKYFKYEDLPSRVPENIRHVSLVYSQFQTVQLMPKTEELKDLQTFLVVQPEWHWQQYKISFPTLNLVGLDDFFLKFTSLETMDLSHTDIEELPGSIAGLRNLQYLSLNGTSIRALPSELCSLRNLQTLKAKDCRFLTELPGDMKELLKLRHLDVTKELGYVHLPHGVEQLTELRTLPVFHASGDSSHCSISELGGLHNLRGCLQLAGLESVKTGSMVQEANLKDKQHLQDLTLQWHDGGADIDADDDEEAENVAEQVLECLQPHANLQELCIRGYEGSVFPAWMQGSLSLPNLVSLTLDCCCNCTQFPAIAQLASLKFLSVRKMYDAQRLISDVHGATKFPSLELLNLWEMYGLEELFEMSEGDCPRLRKVCVSRCPDLKRLPCTPSLGELVLHCCHQFPDIPELASLVSLKIEGFHGVKSFSLTPAALPALKKLEIRCCNELSSVHGLAALTTVQRLKIAGCPKLLFCDESQ